jgi:glycine/D-amino acid oxidase-like deaminating enzyme
VSAPFDIIIVGAGIVGAACAAECAAAGLKTLILDRGIVGGGTTAAGMGHIVVMDDSEAQFVLTDYSRRLWLDLRDQLSADVEYEVCGTLWVAADDEEMAEARRKEKYYAERKVRVEILNSEGVRRAEPNLRPGLTGGLHVVDDGVVYPPCAARFLMDKARRCCRKAVWPWPTELAFPRGGP